MRRQDWTQRFRDFVRERRSMPFEWGRNDCVLLVADWILEATGIDHVADLRGQWHDALSAMRALEERGGMQAAVTAALGEPIDWRLAQRGDAVLIVVDGRESLAVCAGEYALAASEHGALLAPMVDAVCAWRIA